MAGWTVAKRQEVLREKAPRGTIAAVARAVGLTRQFGSKVLHDKAQSYDAAKVAEAQELFAQAAGVTRRTMFGR